MSSVYVIVGQDGRGHGLRAARDFKANELILPYLGDYYRTDVEFYEYMAKTSENVDFDKIFQDETIGWLLGKKTANIENACLINDFADSKFIASLAQCDTLKKIDEWKDMYDAELFRAIKVNRTMNTILEVSCGKVYGKVLKAVKKDEDLLTFYGPEYWIQQLARDKKLPSWKVRAAAVAWLNLQDTCIPQVYMAQKQFMQLHINNKDPTCVRAIMMNGHAEWKEHKDAEHVSDKDADIIATDCLKILGCEYVGKVGLLRMLVEVEYFDGCNLNMKSLRKQKKKRAYRAKLKERKVLQRKLT